MNCSTSSFRFAATINGIISFRSMRRITLIEHVEHVPHSLFGHAEAGIGDGYDDFVHGRSLCKRHRDSSVSEFHSVGQQVVPDKLYMAPTRNNRRAVL